MQASVLNSPDHSGHKSGSAGAAPEPLASVAHFIGLLALITSVVALGFYAQSASSGPSVRGELAPHSLAAPFYLFAMALDWGLFWYCWFGMHRRGHSLWALADLRWRSRRGVVIDILLALALWIVWEGTDHGLVHLLGPSAAKSVDNLLPQNHLEITLWILTSVTAGICEESVFRGYIQRQVHAATGNRTLGVITQAVIFGLGHAYQGWNHVAIISAVGVLYGAFAAWRRTLRINILTHAWGDLWEGWLKFVV